MSPQAALESPVFCFYLAVAAGLLVVAGAALALLKWGLHKDVDHAWRAYRGWLLMVPLGLGCIFLGRAVAITFFTVVAAFGFKEFARATGLYQDWFMTGAVYLGIIATGVVALVPDPTDRNPGWYGMFMALPVYVIALILLIPILRNRTQGQLQAIALSMVGFLYFGWMFGHLIFLMNADHAYSYVLYILFAVELSDVSAFTIGKLFGRRIEIDRRIGQKKRTLLGDQQVHPRNLLHIFLRADNLERGADGLAQMVGASRPRVSSFMNKFRNLGFIDYNDGLSVKSSLLEVVLRD